MQNDVPSLFRPMMNPWRSTLVEAVKQARQEIFCISPYFTDDVLEDVEKTLLSLPQKANPLITFHILTRIRIEDFLTGASELKALERLLAWPGQMPHWTVELRAHQGVHAKVWIIDRQFAVVGSGNATHSGLDRNLEYGIAVADQNFIERIRADWAPLWEESQPISSEQLRDMRRLLEQIERDSQYQHLTEQLQQRREGIVQKSRLPSHLGTPDSPSLRSRVPKILSSTSDSSPAPLPAADSDALTQLTLDALLSTREDSSSSIQEDTRGISLVDHSLLPEKDVLQVVAHELWQALCWLYPFLEDAEQLANEDIHLIWLPQKHVLECMLANSGRSSRAFIEATGRSDEEAWHIELSSEQCQEVQRALLKIIETDALSRQRSLLRLAISKPTRYMHFSLLGEQTIAPFHLQVALSNTAYTWVLKKDVSSRLTIKHTQLIKALAYLERAWYGTGEETTSLPSSSAVEELPASVSSLVKDYEPLRVHFACSAKRPYLELSLKQPETQTSITSSVQGRGLVQKPWGTGRPLSISYTDLWLVLHGSLGSVRHWRLYLDEQMDIIFMPEQPSAKTSNIPTKFLTWWHRFDSRI
jgi:PLD-like domain